MQIHTAPHCNTPQHAATYGNTLQHTDPHTYSQTATRCSTLQHTATHGNTRQHTHTHTLRHASIRCNMLQHTATHCNTYKLTRCNTLQHAVTHGNTRQHTATHGSTHGSTCTLTCCNTLQHTATHSNTLQHTDPHIYSLAQVPKKGAFTTWNEGLARTGVCVHVRVCVCIYTSGVHTRNGHDETGFTTSCSSRMGWLRYLGSLKLYVSFAEYHLFNRALLQKTPIILRSLLIVATP